MTFGTSRPMTHGKGYLATQLLDNEAPRRLVGPTRDSQYFSHKYEKAREGSADILGKPLARRRPK